MSLVSLAIDGLLRRNPGILHPILTVPARTESTRGPFPKPAVLTHESRRRLMGSGNFDEFEDQRFTRGPGRIAAPGRTPVKTYMGFGGQNAVYIEPETRVKSFNAPADYGNLLSKAPVKTFDVAEKTLRTPIKTF